MIEMGFTAKKIKIPATISKEQMEKILESHQKIQDCIDLTNYLRKLDTTQDVDYFQRFVVQANKYL